MFFFFKSQKQKEAKFMASQWIKQVNESANLVNNTKNPDTFFSRYEFMIEKVNDLISIQKYLKFKGDKPTDMLRQINDKKINTINDFIDRYYSDILEQINKLKTDKAKQKRIDKFYSSLVPYFDQMEKENIDKIDKLNLNFKNNSSLKLGNNNGLIEKSNEVELSNLKWYIMISFGKSTSKSYNKAVYLAQNSPKYDAITDENGNITHTATYTSSKKDFLDFIILYDLVSNWKSTFFIINGDLVDKKTVGKIKYCYGDKCRSVKSNFCYGASYMTANPFGCHRLQISQCNNPWWEYYIKEGAHYKLDRDKLIKRIELTKETFKYCPSFNVENIMNVAMSFPLILKKNEYKKIVSEESNIYL